MYLQLISAVDPVLWTIDAAIRANFKNELAALEPKIEQIVSIKINPSNYYFFTLNTNNLTTFFHTTSNQLHKLIDALVDAENEKADLVTKKKRLMRPRTT